MYTNEDKSIIKGRIIKYSVIAGIILVGLIAVFAVLNGMRLQVPAMIALSAAFCWLSFMCIQYIIPCARYRIYLRDMDEGLSREIIGVIENIDDEIQVQDGVRVRSVHVVPDDDEEGRFLYINVDKIGRLPAVGQKAVLNCFGRHIRDVKTV